LNENSLWGTLCCAHSLLYFVLVRCSFAQSCSR